MSNIDINSLAGSQGALPEMLQPSGSEFSLQLVLSYYPPNSSRLPDMFFLSSKSSPSEPEEMVWISSLSTAVAEVWPAVGFRLVPLSPSLSVLLDSVRMSWGSGRVKRRNKGKWRGPFWIPAFTYGYAGRSSDYSKIRCWVKENEAGSQGQRNKICNSNYGDRLDEVRMFLYSDYE